MYQLADQLAGDVPVRHEYPPPPEQNGREDPGQLQYVVLEQVVQAADFYLVLL
jgi:hypothetical protein